MLINNQTSLEIFQKLEQMDKMILELEEQIYTEPLIVKQKIDYILELEKEILELWFTTKTELLKTKAKAFFSLWDLKKAEETFNEIEEYTIKKINFSNDEEMNNSLKQKELIKNSIEKLSLYMKNTWLIYEKDEEKTLVIDESKVKLFEQYFENEIEKLEKYGSTDVWIYYFWLFYSILWNSEKALEKIEDSALLWNKEAIETYTTMVIDIFLYQLKLESENDKEIFIQNNLEHIEEVLFQFIDDYYYEKTWNKQKLTQWWNKYLYEKVWDFYSKIWEFSDSLDSYKSLIQIWFEKSYLLFWKIAELYEKYKYKIRSFDIENIDKLIIDNYKYLLKHAKLVWDIENTALTLEKLWDISKNKEEKYKYYNNSLNVLINSPYYFEWVEKITYRIMNKWNVDSFLIKNEKWDLIIDQFDTLNKIASEEPDYLIVLASKYEEEWNIEYAFYNYLLAYQLKTENSKDALWFFIDTSLRDFIKEEKGKYLIQFKQEDTDENILSNSKINYIEELNNNDYKENQVLLDVILKVVDKNEKLERESIDTLFDFSIDEDFYNNFNINNFNIFLENYKNNGISSDIFLHRILENIFSGNWTNMQSNNVKRILKKIYLKKELWKNDLDLIYDLLNLEIEEYKNGFEYTNKLNSIWKKWIK